MKTRFRTSLRRRQRRNSKTQADTSAVVGLSLDVAGMRGFPYFIVEGMECTVSSEGLISSINTNEGDEITVYINPFQHGKSLTPVVDNILRSQGRSDLVDEANSDDDDDYLVVAAAGIQALVSYVFPNVQLKDVFDEATFEDFDEEWVSQFNDAIDEGGWECLEDLASLKVCPVYEQQGSGECSHAIATGSLKRSSRDPKRNKSRLASAAKALKDKTPASKPKATRRRRAKPKK